MAGRSRGSAGPRGGLQDVSEIEARETFTRAGFDSPFTQRRLSAFLVLHCLALGSEVAALVNFAATRDWWFFFFILFPFLFSGAFCAHAAWHCDAPRSGSGWLPLKSKSFSTALPLVLPLGFFQGVIVLLALEEHRGQSHRSDSLTSMRPASNKFHCKAVNGVFEGLLSSAVLLYAFWTIGWPPPPHHPITAENWHQERLFLGCVGAVSFTSSGLGLLELDFCVSRAISRRMRRSMRYEFLHWLFRTSEVGSHVIPHIGLMVTMRICKWWWYLPFLVDFLATIFLVRHYGGVEKSWFVTLLVSIPASFANVFIFIDSPYKRRAASNLSRCLTMKKVVGLVALPLLTTLASEDILAQLRRNVEYHLYMLIFGVTSILVYWPLWWWVTSRTMHRNDIVDIYSACQSGSVAAVRSAIRDLTHSAAVGLDVNHFDIDGTTPLMLAAAKGYAQVCHLLILEGARVNKRILSDYRPVRRFFEVALRRRWTALHLAAQGGHKETVLILLEAAANEAEGDITREAYQDTVLDTPLHVAARAGHFETVRLLAAERPHWANILNAQHQRPVDLARTEEVQRAIVAPQEGADGRHQVLLLRRPQGALPCLDEHVAVVQAWPQEQLPISRTAPESTLHAPGLCSYIASSCGGALGRLFLAEGGTDPTISRLTSITEVSDSQIETDSQIESFVSSLHSPSAPSAAPAMEDLEPIDSTGSPVKWWIEMAASRRGASVSERASGANFTRVPEESVLGEGAYGLVWRARDRLTSTWYAVKNIKTHRRGDLSIATRECEVAAHIRLKPHPCIVRLHHVHNYTDASLYVLVMEFCPGGDLLGRIRGAKSKAGKSGDYTPPLSAMTWIGQIFLGLEHMHLRMDTLLRDLKPENVVLSNDGRAKLTDFGFGRFGVESVGITWSFGIPAGSPGYVAPEVLRKQGYDYRADLYSLGVLAWVMFTGGLRSHREPIPPMGRMRHGGDFEAHFQDFHLLAQCLQNPGRYDARPLGDDVRDFVSQLTQRRPNGRPRHDDIRQHRFMQPLELPAYNAPPAAVERWLSKKR